MQTATQPAVDLEPYGFFINFTDEWKKAESKRLAAFLDRHLQFYDHAEYATRKSRKEETESEQSSREKAYAMWNQMQKDKRLELEATLKTIRSKQAKQPYQFSRSFMNCL
jgi:hypothetical protein